MSTLSLLWNSGPGLASESTCLYEHAESLGPCLAVNPLEGAGSSIVSHKYCMDTALTLVIQGWSLSESQTHFQCLLDSIFNHVIFMDKI